MTDPAADEGKTPRRTHSRLRVGIPAQLETLDGRVKVRLVDLSQGGAQVVLEHAGKVRQAVLTWLTFEAFGIVAWQKGDHIGFEFDDPIPHAVLLETRKRAPSVVQEEALGVEAAAQAWATGVFNSGQGR